jgi:hypothetical protein
MMKALCCLSCIPLISYLKLAAVVLLVYPSFNYLQKAYDMTIEPKGLVRQKLVYGFHFVHTMVMGFVDTVKETTA